MKEEKPKEPNKHKFTAEEKKEYIKNLAIAGQDLRDTYLFMGYRNLEVTTQIQDGVALITGTKALALTEEQQKQEKENLN